MLLAVYVWKLFASWWNEHEADNITGSAEIIQDIARRQNAAYGSQKTRKGGCHRGLWVEIPVANGKSRTKCELVHPGDHYGGPLFMVVTVRPLAALP